MVTLDVVVDIVVVVVIFFPFVFCRYNSKRKYYGLGSEDVTLNQDRNRARTAVNRPSPMTVGIFTN